VLDLKGRIVALDVDPLAPALQEADHAYVVPRVDALDYITCLTRICCAEQVDLIFPLIDPDVPILSRHREEIEATGARLAVVSSVAADIITDKWLTAQFFSELGIRTPQCWLPESLEADNIEYPVFIKPRRGSAGKHAVKITGPRDLSFFCGCIDAPIIQEFLPGPEITNDVVCDLEGEVLGVVSRQRIEVRWGEVAKGVTVLYPGIIEACVRIARELRAIGPITVQCIFKHGVPHFTEINGRFGGGVPLAIAAGVDAPLWLLSRAAGLPIEIPPLGTYKVGLYLTRFDESFFLSEADVEQIRSRYI